MLFIVKQISLAPYSQNDLTKLLRISCYYCCQLYNFKAIYIRCLQRSASGAATPEKDAATDVAKPEPVNDVKDEPEPATSETDPKPDVDEADLQKSPERPSTLSVEPISETPATAQSPAGSTMSRRDSQLTDRGYFDVKFYHNKLW